MTLRPGRLLAGILLTFLLALPATAQAVTVNLRIEGATRTLFQGAVNAEPIASLSLPSSGGPHPCDVRANTGDPGDPVAATPFGALVAGAQAAGLSLDAAWFEFGGTGDFLVREVGGDQATDTAFWGFAVNYAEAMVGGCQIPLAGGEQVLYAYDYFSQNELLTLSGPTVMNVGEHAQRPQQRRRDRRRRRRLDHPRGRGERVVQRRRRLRPAGDQAGRAALERRARLRPRRQRRQLRLPRRALGRRRPDGAPGAGAG
jgi:hypothetical protein